MRPGAVLIGALVAALAACAAPDSRLDDVRAGTLKANNIAFFDGVEQSRHGDQVLTASGQFRSSGPVIICVFRAIPAEAAEFLKKEGVRAAEHTAYLLPEGADFDAAGMRRMRALGPVDPNLSDTEIAARFGLDISYAETEGP